MPRKNLLGECHRLCGAGAPARGFYRWKKNFCLHPGHVEWKQSTVLNHLPRYLVFTRGELAERNLLAIANAVNQRKVRGGQQPQVLAVLLVDALDIFSNHHPNSRAHLRVRRLFAARSFPPALSADRTNKPTALHVAAANRCDASAFQAEIRNLSKSLI